MIVPALGLNPGHHVSGPQVNLNELTDVLLDGVFRTPGPTRLLDFQPESRRWENSRYKYLYNYNITLLRFTKVFSVLWFLSLALDTTYNY